MYVYWKISVSSLCLSKKQKLSYKSLVKNDEDLSFLERKKIDLDDEEREAIDEEDDIITAILELLEDEEVEVEIGGEGGR